MALPVGVSTCQITYGATLSPVGAVAAITGRVLMSQPVFHAASKTTMRSGADEVAGAESVSFVVPHVDQPGYVDADGQAVTMWHYTFVGQVRFANNVSVQVRIPFQPRVGTATLDLDEVAALPVDAETLPLTVVSSVAGLTGAVSAEDLAAALGDSGGSDSDVAGYVSDADSETRTALNALYAGSDIPYDERTNLTNATRQTLRRFTAAMNRQAVGGGACKVAFVGDSITAGQFASNKTYAGPAQLVRLLASMGVPAVTGAIYFHDLTNGQGVRDPRITAVGAGWNSSSDGPAYVCARANSPAGTLNLAPGRVFDRVTISFAGYSGGGTLAVKIGADAVVNASTATGPEMVGSVTLNAGSRADQAITIGGTGDVLVHAVRCWDSTTPTGLEVAKIANPGLDTAQATIGANYGGMKAIIQGIGHDLAVVMVGTNDASGSVALATYRSRLLALANRIITDGADCLLVVPPPQSDKTTEFRRAYDDQIYSVAEELNVPVLDLHRRWNYDYAFYNTAPSDYFADYVHPNDLGYADIARAWATALTHVL